MTNSNHKRSFYDTTDEPSPSNKYNDSNHQNLHNPHSYTHYETTTTAWSDNHHKRKLSDFTEGSPPPKRARTEISQKRFSDTTTETYSPVCWNGDYCTYRGCKFQHNTNRVCRSGMDCTNKDCSLIHEAQTSPQTDSIQPPTATHKDSTAQQQKFKNYNPINNPQKQRTSNRNNHNQNQHGNYTMDTTPTPTPESSDKKIDGIMLMMKEMQKTIATLSKQRKNSNPPQQHNVQRTHQQSQNGW